MNFSPLMIPLRTPFSAILFKALALVLIAAALQHGCAQAASVRNWRAAPADGNFSNSANWDALPATGDSLNFGASSITALNNDFAAGMSFGGITFAANASAYTISGSAIVLTGNVTNSGTNLETINIAIAATAARTFTASAGGGDIAIGGAISGAAGAVNKTGSGTLTLSGNNVYTGGTTINGGVLRAGNSTAGQSSTGSAAVSVNSGALGGNGMVGAAVNATAGAKIDLRDGNLGTLTLGSTLTLSGSAAAPNNLYFDLGDLSAGTDQITAAGLITVNVAGGAVINLTQLSAAGGGAGTIDDGTYTLITSSAGIASASNFILGSSQAFGKNFALVPSANALQLTVTRIGPAGPAAAFWTGSAGAVWNAVGNWNTDAASAVPTNAIPGVGTNVTFFTTNPAAADLATSLGQNIEINSLSFSPAATTAVTIAGAPNTLALDATNANAHAAGNGISDLAEGVTHTIASKVLLGNSQTWTVGPASGASTAALTVSGVVSDFGQFSTLTKAGTGTLTLASANLHSGGTTLSAGTLKSGVPTALGPNTSVLRLNGGILDLADATATPVSENYSTVIGGNVTILSDRSTSGAGLAHNLGALSIGANTLTVDKGPNVTSTAGAVARVTFLATTLTGNVTLDSENAVILILGNGSGNGLLSGNFNITCQSTDGTGFISFRTGNSNATRTSGVLTLASGTISLNDLNIANPNILGSLGTSLQLNGGLLDIQMISSVAPYSTAVGGNVTILSNRGSSGTGVAHILGALSIGTNTLSVSGGNDSSSGTAGLTFGAVTLNGNATFSVTNSTFGAATLLTLGALNDGGTTPRTITKTGEAPLTLAAAAASLINGTQVNISAGTLNANTAIALGSLAAVDVADGAVFNVGANQTIGALSNSGSVTLGANTLTVGSTNNLSSTFSGIISGTGAVTKAGTGSLFLNGVNTYFGPTTVSNGDLRGTGSLNNSTVSVAAGGSLWPGISTAGSPTTPSAGEKLTINALDLSAGGKLKIVLNPNAVQNLVVAGSACNLTNGSLSVAAQNTTYSVGTVYTIISCSGAIITAPFPPAKVNLPNGIALQYSNTMNGAIGVDPNVTPVQYVQLIVTSAGVTPVTMDSFTAQSDGAGVLLNWLCVSEFQNAGFNIYRKSVQDITWTRVNPALIAGRVTNPDAKKYGFCDWPMAGEYEYKLESISVQGSAETYYTVTGTVVVDPSADVSKPDSHDNVGAALESVQAEVRALRARNLATAFLSMAARAEVRAIANPSMLSAQPAHVSASTIQSAPIAPAAGARWFSKGSVNETNSYIAAKLVYQAPGVLLVPRSSLPPGFDSDHVAVQREGRSVAALTVTAAGLLLYGPGYSDDYTDKDVFFLRSTSSATASGAPDSAQGLFDDIQVANTLTPASATVEYHDVYFDYNTAFRPYTFAPWFSNQYLTGGSAQRFDITTAYASSAASTLTVNVWNLTQADSSTPDHALQVVVNGTPVGQAQWNGGGQMLQLTFQIPSGVLVNGSNQLELVTPGIDGVPNQIAFLHSMRVAYTRSLDGSHPVTLSNPDAQAKLFELNHLPSASAWVVDARYPERAALVPYQTQLQLDGTYSLRFIASPGGTGMYQVVPMGMENKPFSVSRRIVKPISASPYLAVGPEQFSAGVQPLLVQRSKEGLRGQFADQEQLFDYYNYGRYGPAGIQNAVRSVRPKYLLLAGRTTYDYHNYSGANVDPLCPTFLVSTTFWAQATSDSMFGDLGRGYPEVAVGRLPVNTASELSAAVAHILNAKCADNCGARLHAVADAADPDAGDFAAQLTTLKQANPDLAWQENYLGRTCATPPEVSAAMTAAANGGADWILYSGHGNASRLGKNVPNILDMTTVQAWTGSAVFIQCTCTANWMANDTQDFKSIAIQALTQSQGGISASIGTSTYMNSNYAIPFMAQLLKNANSGTMRWGDALMNAQRWAAQQGGGYYSDLNRTEQIFGDPAMPVFMKSVPAGGQPVPSGAGNSGSPAAGTF